MPMMARQYELVNDRPSGKTESGRGRSTLTEAFKMTKRKGLVELIKLARDVVRLITALINNGQM
ncbi:hypothetical protein EF096_01985 [Pseudomonas neustonica]|uniref:Uncharacterized protein n=1 Tax=Pseudomonas neustonica TaxID=2487346 RepID=A0ABX9XNE3_9PSED|nr:hypothetical protein EF099_00715 [Pseudomonas sp. SSM44]ROZ88484.1 hypothetical protein EF096_01985 [Pseudomonas neustonica]